MSPNSLWTPIKFTVSSSMPNCSCPSSSQLQEYTGNWLLSLLQTRILMLIDQSLSSLDGWHWSVCHAIQMQYLRLFFSVEPIASSFIAEVHTLEQGLVWCNNHKTTCYFSKFFYGLPIGSFPTLKGPFISLAKTPLKCLVSGLLIFQQCDFKLSMGIRSCWYPWKWACRFSSQSWNLPSYCDGSWFLSRAISKTRYTQCHK